MIVAADAAGEKITDAESRHMSTTAAVPNLASPALKLICETYYENLRRVPARRRQLASPLATQSRHRHDIRLKIKVAKTDLNFWIL